MFVQMNSNFLLAAAFLSALRTFGLAFSVLLLAVFVAIVVSRETLATVHALVWLFAGVLATMMIPRVLPSKAYVAVLALKRFSSGVQ